MQLMRVDPGELARSMQTELSRLGCLSGKVDGKWGPGSQKALKDFAGRQGIKLASLEPDVQILDKMKATSVRVCPLVCGRNQEERNGRCVAVKKEAKVDPKPAERTVPDTKSTPIEKKSSPSAQQKETKNATGRTCKVCKWNDGRDPYGFTRTCYDDIGWARQGRYLTCQ